MKKDKKVEQIIVSELMLIANGIMLTACQLVMSIL